MIRLGGSLALGLELFAPEGISTSVAIDADSVSHPCVLSSFSFFSFGCGYTAIVLGSVTVFHLFGSM